MHFVVVYKFLPNGEEEEAHTTREDWEDMMKEILTSLDEFTESLTVQRVMLVDEE
jgi:hypothetical protein